MAKQQQMDSGWSWVVLASSWLSLLLFSFVNSSAGIMQVEMIEDLGVGAGPISIMTSFALGMASLLGPLGGVLSQLLSVRFTVFLGIILMSFGMLAASFSHSLPVMMFFYGLMTGLGFGIAYSPVIIVISFYFEKHRMLANGIILCAPGLGLLSYPYFIRYILDTHGWRFALALNGAITLHVLVFAAVFFPTDTEKKSMIKFPSLCCWSKSAVAEETENGTFENVVNGTGSVTLHSCEDLKLNGLKSKKLDLLLKSGVLVDSGSLISVSKSQSLSVQSASFHNVNKPYKPVYINGTPINGTPEISRAFPLSVSERGLSPLCDPSAKNGSIVIPVEDLEKSSHHLSPFWHRTGSDISAFSSLSGDSRMTSNAVPLSPGKYRFGQLRKGDGRGRTHLGSSIHFASSDLGSSLVLPFKIEEVAAIDGMNPDSSVFRQFIRICKHKGVWLLSINSFFFICGCGIHAIHFPAYAESKGMSRQQVAQFYTVFGVVLLVGRLSGGIIFNKLKPPLRVLLMILQTLNGVSLGLAPFYATTAVGIYIMETAIGIMYGQSYLILPSLVAEIMGVHDMAITFGITHLFLGLGYIMTPILAGFIYDATGTYDIPFHIAGTMVVFGAIFIVPMFFLEREANADQATNIEKGKEMKDVAEAEKGNHDGEGKENLKSEDEETPKNPEEEEDERTVPLMQR